MKNIFKYIKALREEGISGEKELEMRRKSKIGQSILFTLRALFVSRRRIESKMSNDQLKQIIDKIDSSR